MTEIVAWSYNDFVVGLIDQLTGMEFNLTYSRGLYYGPLIIVSPVRSTYGGYYGLVVVPPRPPPRPQTLHRSHDNLKNSYRIASIFYM